jgi:hypothetical protein
MFKFEEICELIQLVGSSGVATVEVEHAGSRVRIEISDDGPAEFERNDMDLYDTWREELRD